jgi:hypothetical protein
MGVVIAHYRWCRPLARIRWLARLPGQRMPFSPVC